ncbi:patatin-like protein [Pseudopontixanthobacter vadosimaris]|uniref:patatin-like protein n=1 Tax=Pseudopontixanthobacter vadosimaris TaxID=2726450 RepID=UPI001472B9C1|nr:patatin-like protein [Pseudopontixanthobacter vadosimaris]
MRQKELRIALVCYGGVSLAVYMHGVTKEVWKLARASRSFHAGAIRQDGSQGIYRDLLQHMQDHHGLRLRVMPDILTGASAGGINAVFLAQAIHSGQSLEPLTDMWLENADVGRLTDPGARPVWRFAKTWAQPIAWWLLRRPGNAVSDSVAPETREEVRNKVSRLIRGRWFAPPFSGSGFTRLLHDALTMMASGEAEHPLLPPGHPVDLFVTATDFHGYREVLRLNSPGRVEESEHRLPIGFRSKVPSRPGEDLADPMELIFAARATASFPGAFPPLRLSEIDELSAAIGNEWAGRDEFLERIMPAHVRQGSVDNVSLIDGSVLVNAPFSGAMAALQGRPAQREVDRRFVYIDPRPDRLGSSTPEAREPVGFFAAIFGSLSTIPREQPIRDNLEVLADQSQEARRLRQIITVLRPEVEQVVEKLFGRTLFLDRPTPKRLKIWRAKAQQAAAETAGYAYHSYAQAKFAGILDGLARSVLQAAPGLAPLDPVALAAVFRQTLQNDGLPTLSASGGGANPAAIAFFRAHDTAFRVRRLRFMLRRLARDWEADPDIPDPALEDARAKVFTILALYFSKDSAGDTGDEFAARAKDAMSNPAAVLEYVAGRQLLPEIDANAEQMLADALEKMPRALRRRMLLAYLGFPFYDVATLPLLRNEGLTEFDPVKVDRISPDDALSIRNGGTAATLRGTEFYNFGAFFSRAYRENDYLWGRLHGAERMIDLVYSTAGNPAPGEALPGTWTEEVKRFKRSAFLAILDEEDGIGRLNANLISGLRAEVHARMG